MTDPNPDTLAAMRAAAGHDDPEDFDQWYVLDDVAARVADELVAKARAEGVEIGRQQERKRFAGTDES